MNETPEPPDNMPLRTMIVVGILLAVIGCITWLANTDLDASMHSNDSSPAGQAIGSGILSLGVLLLVIGWTVTAIARAIEIGKR